MRRHYCWAEPNGVADIKHLRLRRIVGSYAHSHRTYLMGLWFIPGPPVNLHHNNICRTVSCQGAGKGAASLLATNPFLGHFLYFWTLKWIYRLGEGYKNMMALTVIHDLNIFRIHGLVFEYVWEKDQERRTIIKQTWLLSFGDSWFMIY